MSYSVDAKSELRAALKAALDYLGKAYAVKAISSVVQTYLDDLTRDFQDVLDGTLIDSEARRRHRRYLRDVAPEAYLAGYKEAGIEGAELDDDDRAIIANWVETQSGFVGGLWDAVYKLMRDYENAMIDRPAYEARRRALYERIGLWGTAVRELADKARATAAGNLSVTWKLGATEEHCSTCAKLDGQRHRLKWFTSRDYIPQAQGSPTLECHGWRCQCVLVDDKGKQILPSAE